MTPVPLRPLGAERLGEVGDSRGLRLPHLIPGLLRPIGAEKEDFQVSRLSELITPTVREDRAHRATHRRRG
jgi:hypothetical protein